METMLKTAGLPRMSAEVLEQTIALNPYIPHIPWPKQMAFLELECLDALIGGAASGGKSDALLMAALQFVTVPGYAALIVRRHFADLKLPGGLIDRSIDWLRPHSKTGTAKWNAQEHKWVFKSGAVLQFGYADREGDEKRYDGSELQFIGLDEACHFTERQIVYFYERLRRKGNIPVPLRMRLGTTPGGPGHEFIHRRYVKPGTAGKGFVPATVDDNPAVDATQYRLSLEEIRLSNPLRYRQMLLGDWEAVAGGRFEEKWLRNSWEPVAGAPGWVVLRGAVPFPDGEHAEVERFDASAASTFQTYDPSASASKDADHFVVSTWKVTPRANLVWWGCHRAKAEFNPQLMAVKSLYREHRPQFIAVEELLNQRGQAQELRRSTNPVMVVRSVNPKGRKKLDRALGAIALAGSGRLFLPRAHDLFPLDEVRGELIRFTGEDGDSDDVCLVAGTPIATEHGERPIEDIRPGDRVWTRCGLRRVTASGMTSESTRVLRVTLDDGREVVGTPSHPIFVSGCGFARMDTLAYDDKIVVWENHEPKPSSSTGSPTGDTPTQSGAPTACISKGGCVAGSPTSTATSGCITTGQSRHGTRFTTPTGTRSTTTSGTSCASRTTSTAGSTRLGARTVPRPSSRTWSASARWLRSGTVPKRGGSGTRKTHVAVGRSASRSPSTAGSAVGALKTCSPTPCTAPVPVLLPPGARRVWTTRIAPARSVGSGFASTGTPKPRLAHARVLTVSEAGFAPVFNLTVEGDHEYFANGILTHNCDTLSYAVEQLPFVRPGGPGSARSAPFNYVPQGLRQYGGVR